MGRASAALYACALMVANTRYALSPAGVTIATLVYVSFAVVLIVRWPSWLLAAVSTGPAGHRLSLAAATRSAQSGTASVTGAVVAVPARAAASSS